MFHNFVQISKKMESNELKVDTMRQKHIEDMAQRMYSDKFDPKTFKGSLRKLIRDIYLKLDLGYTFPSEEEEDENQAKLQEQQNMLSEMERIHQETMKEQEEERNQERVKKQTAKQQQRETRKKAFEEKRRVQKQDQEIQQ